MIVEDYHPLCPVCGRTVMTLSFAGQDGKPVDPESQPLAERVKCRACKIIHHVRDIKKWQPARM